MRNLASQIIEKLNLNSHPDGGFYFETLRDTSVFLSTSQLPPTYKVDRAVSSAIYFLLQSGSVACLHRIPCSETFHFYLGDPLTVVELDDKTGHVKLTRVGSDLLEGQQPQYTVPPNVWFGAIPTKDLNILPDGSVLNAEPKDSEKHYSLVGITCAPAFQFQDNEIAKHSELVSRFPDKESLISLLTIPDRK
ncbi:Cupin domain of unknown function DUF985 [Dillenia turbinata]|uniref:DUF985 domain-containing protein n=1 Tax=Dillenia turbinata TaxID=194707 RepID=A0AAN8ZPG5_9MAGN